jgi:hypothetical protein
VNDFIGEIKMTIRNTIICGLTLIASGLSSVSFAQDLNERFKTPQTTCTNNEYFKEFMVLAKFATDSNDALYVSVFKQHKIKGMAIGTGTVTSFQVLKPLKVVRTDTETNRTYRGKNFLLKIKLNKDDPSDLNGTLKMPLERKKVKMDINCVDQKPVN